MPLQNPVVVIPGITASTLRDTYLVEPEHVWSTLLHKSYKRITLHPEDLRYELVEPARVVPDAAFHIPYGELIEELRYNLRSTEDEPVPVFPFAYDWRKPLAEVVPQLAAFVMEVIGRTKLLRHYAGTTWETEPQVDLVGHSMGGLLIAGYLAAEKSGAPIGRIATLGTPFQGSYEAMIKVLTGTALLSPLEPSSREREAARLTPALYHLLPSFAGAVLDASSNASVDPFELDAWQAGVIETIAEFIRMYGSRRIARKTDRLEEARQLLSNMLIESRDYIADSRGIVLSDCALDQSDWLVIAGVDADTRVRLKRSAHGREVWYDLSSEDRRNDWYDGPDRYETGDGTVPLRGAVPTFLNPAGVVCVRPGDLGYWELGDKALLGQVGWHGLLPKCNLVHRLVLKHLKREKADKTVWGAPLPDVEVWAPPIQGLEHKG
jgi:pimeloyl-ACP methyl ester carboxylesterase